MSGTSDSPTEDHADHQLEDHADDQLNEIEQLRRQVEQLHQALATERLERVRADKAIQAQLRPMIDGMRLDRQARRSTAAVVRAGRQRARSWRTRRNPGGGPVVVVCPAYPDGDRGYAGQFVRARVLAYVARGIPVRVVVTDARAAAGSPAPTVVDGVAVHRVRVGAVTQVVEELAPSVIAVHHMLPPIWQALRSFAGRVPMAVWVHGYEARDWRELRFNFTDDEVREREVELEGLNRDRRATMAEVFAHPRIEVVFVSHFMRSIAETFAGQSAANGTVIPNPVDSSIFRFRQREPEERWKLLWVRSFAARNYSGDLARDALLLLAKEPRFEQMSVTIVGDGRFFDEWTTPLRDLPNVQIRRGYVSTDELVHLHGQHGIALVPTRWDSQGLTCLEAMSSGLVPVTNAVAAVPEYVPADAGMLCPPDDPQALADAVRTLQDDPQEFVARSARGAEAVRRTCDVPVTLDREIELISALVPTTRR